MRKMLLSLALALAAAAAQAVPLSALLDPGAFLIIGDKKFDNWSVIFQDASEPGRTVNTANIDVIALADGGLNPGPGLQFNILENELAVTGDGTYAYLDFQFGFRVSVLDPGLRIKDNSLANLVAFYSWNPAVTGDGPLDAGSYIRETIGTAPGLDDLGIKDVQFSYADGIGQIADLADSAAFDPQSEIWVTKNLLVWATALTDQAGIVAFEQRFSQQPVPEPASIALVGLALAGLGAIRRRRD